MTTTDVRKKRLAVQPEADTDTVESLVRKVRAGQVRIPSFQRDLKWNAKDVRDLFDSVYVGYPIGALLLRKAPAEAEQLTLGPLRIQAPETPSALWVVDGQQRLVSLAAALDRPVPIPTTPDDPYVVYFDPEARSFETPPRSGYVPSTWVPLAELLDATRLSEWVFNWPHVRNTALRQAVFDAGTRIRQYTIPLYTVETEDPSILEEIFYRINNKGKSLEWKEVFNAMFGGSGAEPSTLADLSARLVDVGIGTVSEDLLLNCVVASKGLDVTQNVSVHYDRHPELLRHAVAEALPALRSMLGFLRDRAEIPHIKLLPSADPLPALTRFFESFPDPSPRVKDLLSRWTWRVLLGQTPLNRLTLLRRSVSAIEAPGPEEAAQALLGLTRADQASRFELPDRFDARSAASRIALLGLASLEPLDPGTHHPLDVAALIESNTQGVRRIWRGRTGAPEEERDALRSPANRILLPGKGLARRSLFEALERNLVREVAVLRSHAFDERAVVALREDDVLRFVEAREEVVEGATCALIDRMTGWAYSDRPSIEHLLAVSE